MIKITVLDDTAEARSKLFDRIQRLIESNAEDFDIVPSIDLKPVSRQELKFQDAPDICIIGSGILSSSLQDVGAIRRLLPDSALCAALCSQTASCSAIEHLARLGIDDFVQPEVSAAELVRKIVLLSRKMKRGKPGKLVVIDSGKGGLGVTSIAAAVAGAMVTHGKKVAVMDFDSDTQDLSRFLQARPFINENLQLLFDRQRPVTQEYVEQVMVRVWSEGSGVLTCIPPVEEDERLYSSAANYSRVLLSILEVLDSTVDCVVADIGNARSSILRTLYRVADKVLFLISNDPAALYASTDKLAKLRGYLSADAEIVLALNNPCARGLPQSPLMAELNRALGFSEKNWVRPAIPYCDRGRRWPGSGGTLYSESRAALRSAVEGTLCRLGLHPVPSSSCNLRYHALARVCGFLTGTSSLGNFWRRKHVVSSAAGPRNALPPPSPTRHQLPSGQSSGFVQLPHIEDVDLDQIILPAVVS